MHDARALLEKTREAIVIGQFDRLKNLIDATDDLLSQLPGATAEELAAIRSCAARNQGLIRAALAGLRPSASLDGSFSGYGTDGRRIAGSTGPAIERRA
ncbi:hypothetical protein CDV50_00025 [Haematobacter massiliensis]|uniref:Uncharacterized protein n=1 Tax=Haematobacter massiliensis TaxID=195105 RepID=A0A086YAH8_9RHOB|nr:hypothetical protein [Haematobacter massiliensis]KFI31278.1 hypothetical protein CN97_09610 [Haematobacter massiliensis]OWJ74149.1 hypothetical protein CDV50_00025 [Haematobacter massiliensis]OWJ87016.1 hypothetical protein CDV51_08430 [Haematobacter massiliensis]QBJ23350.1 hypothetical protein HmaOT1_03160 [Haematobacter massiliensis]